MTIEDRGRATAVVRSVAEELRVVLARARTLTALRALELPTLDGLLEEAGRTRGNLVDSLVEAIERIDDLLYKSAAQDLFPLPYTDTEWPKLGSRARNAATRFNVGYDGFRRGGNGRPSRMDEVVEQIAWRLVEVLSGTAPVGSSPAEASADFTTRFPPGWARRARMPVAVIVGLSLVAFLGFNVLRPRWEHATCRGEVGALDEDLMSEPSSSDLAARLRAAFAKEGGTSIGCARDRAFRWHALVVQELVRNGVPDGALLVALQAEAAPDTYLNGAAWTGYHQIGGKNGDTAQVIAGLPGPKRSFPDGHVEIELSKGTILVAERTDAPYFWLHGPLVSWWRQHQRELGLPTGNPLENPIRQDFQHGFATIDPTRPAEPAITPIDHPERGLPSARTRQGRILGQLDATSWWITPTGRQWIPDGDVWNCLGGADRELPRKVHGYEIATLPFEGQAHCPTNA